MWLDWIKTKDPRVEVNEVRQRRTKVEIPKERVRELLEAEARRLYTGSGKVDTLYVREGGIASSDPVKEYVAVFIFQEKI